MKKNFPFAALLLSASPYVLAQAQVEAAAVAQAAAVQPAAAADVTPDDIQKVVIVSTGSRGAQRTMVDTPVPVDIIGSRELTKTGQASLDKALQFRVPSFNTVQTPVNDATSLLDPYEIRNMGPSRVLILINGKRKNASSLVYTQTSPGRGESGSDISAIPQDAIKRIEVLRDGASAQYGSDAIAGVVNIILKDNAEGGSITARAGITHESDGKMGGLSLNQGVALGDRGFVNYTLDLSHVGLSNRPGRVDARAEPDTLGGTLADAQAFLAIKPDAGNINGSPATSAQKALVNSRYELSDDVSLYGNAAYVHKQVDSYANYRTPYWRPTDYGLLHPAGTPYLGYVPTFVGKLDDYNATGGVKFQLGGWGTDLSLTYGGNEQSYEVGNSVNRSLGAASPTHFNAGGVKFEHFVLNGDISKQVASTVSAYAGTEIRHEKFKTIAGEEASYIGTGADSFAGNDPRNSFPTSRSNYGVYGGATWDISDSLLVDGTGRYEKYSDFGSAFVWKLSSRLKVSDQLTLRASASTGFRAPSLAQIYTQKAQYSFVPGKGIQVSGLVNNVSKEAAALGVPKLQAEKSDNITLGLGLKPDNNTSITVDYYNIKVKNRIVLGKEIVPACNETDPVKQDACVKASPLDQVLNANGIVSVSFFANALTSRTSGIDYVLSRKNLTLGEGKVTLNLSGNLSLKNEREGAVNNPSTVAAANQSVLDPTQEALMFTSRPKYKTIFGADLDYRDYNFSLNNTMFGPTRFRNAGLDNNLEVEFKTKVVTDFAFNYNVAKNVTLSFNINNILNVTPKWNMKALNSTGQALLDSKTKDAVTGMTPSEVQYNSITFDGRYSMVTYDGSQFSQLGRTFAASLNYRF
ncbi:MULTISPECIES: TonB-dependent siderophore receptor [unclassified Duganella]|uniref:TonB-dependent receptor plug domain-containing protein n=1 Tax=unclassified Duganella TaxID=2636909 RepID=UPI000E349370|nr:MULTISPECIES: TonB-dependent receptor [unclassified Duganella]RFP09987.1 TonB-dependent receptor [Duganella sp. BJB475]RFP25708.1 TonB-dependent receptor [Duganella sp. BJB476]